MLQNLLIYIFPQILNFNFSKIPELDFHYKSNFNVSDLFDENISFPVSAAVQKEWEDDVNLRIKYAVMYGKYAGFICIGDIIVLVTGWKKGSGFTNTLRLIYAS